MSGYGSYGGINEDARKKYGGEYTILDRHYGKSNVKLLHIDRSGKVHTAREIEVDTKLTLTTDKDYITGDNGDIVATDSQKNIVYVMAKQYGVKNPEEFALLLAKFFLDKYVHVTQTNITVVEYPWERIQSEGRAHNHAYIFVPICERYATVHQRRGERPAITGGLRGLRVLKTTQSSFVNFVDDEFRTLPDADDRVFSTVVDSSWNYHSVDHVKIDFDKSWNTVKDSILEKFAGPPDDGLFSASVQNTLYESERVILDRIPEIESIKMSMPNKHYFTVDLSKFPENRVGKGLNKSVLLPVDKPSGFIHAELGRSHIKSKL